MHQDKDLPNIKNALTSSIGHENLTTVVDNLAEYSIDQIIESDSLRDFPIVGTVIAFAKIGINIRDRIFLEKIYRFLYQIKNVSREARIQFHSRIQNNPKYREKVGENLILAIERHSTYSKSEMLGKVYLAHLEGNIDEDMVQRLTTSIDKVNDHDIKYLLEFYNDPDSVPQTAEQLQSLAFAGLLKIEFVHGLVFDSPMGSFEKCSLGEAFIKYAIDQ